MGLHFLYQYSTSKTVKDVCFIFQVFQVSSMTALRYVSYLNYDKGSFVFLFLQARANVI